METSHDVRKGWYIVREEVGKIEAQITELEDLFLRRNIRSSVREVIQHHYSLFSASSAAINDVRRSCKELREWIDHDMWSHFSVIAYFIYLLQNDAIEMMIRMRSNMRMVLFAIESIRFWVPEESLTPPTVVSVKHFFETVQEFFNRRYKSYHQEMGKKSMIQFENTNIHANILAHIPTLAILLMNICENACKHGLAQSILIKVIEAENEVHIEVSDDGIGIEPEIAEQMFEVGFTSGNGTGLGLANAKERMKFMQGDIDYETHGGIGSGAKFDLKLRRMADVS